ncbi:MAG: hypothetical protein NZ481_05020 [Candidatus Kapabacteria bacterium]|nr:hypothetical protein [Candidatus Kapabacteria bacterium]
MGWYPWLSYWQRVHENGLFLAERTGANLRIVELFAYLHDACRWNEGDDPDHGKRAGELVRKLVGTYFTLSPEETELLVYACTWHAHGLTEADVTVQTCWDADRLDLGRVGIYPNPRFLCTDVARDRKTIQWAFARSLEL